MVFEIPPSKVENPLDSPVRIQKAGTRDPITNFFDKEKCKTKDYPVSR